MPKSDNSGKSSSGLFRPLNILLLMVVTFLAVFYKEYQRTSWFNAKPLTRDLFPSRPFEVKELPITYYKVGELHKVLDTWHKGEGLNSYARLYRVAPDSKPFEFNPEIMTAKAQVEMFMEDCEYPESVICKVCLDKSIHHVMNVSEIMSAPTNYYASFAKLDHIPAVQGLIDSLGIPGMDVAKLNFEHAFIGNFPEDRITAFAHGNTVTSSMSIQFVGSKNWIFFPPHVFKDREFLDSYGATGISVPSKGPDGPFEIYFLQSQPGDIIFFSENWGHIVKTNKGPNVMFNLRKLEVGNILRRPVQWLIAVLNGKLYPTQNNLGRQRTPFTDLYFQMTEKVHNLCKDGQISDWDRDLLEVLKNGPPSQKK